MKLASLKKGGRDGTLIVVNRDLTEFVIVTEVADTLQQAMDDWPNTAPRLNAVSEMLNQGNTKMPRRSITRRWRRLYPAHTNSWTAAPTCRMLNASGAPVAPKCRNRSTTTH